MRPRKLTFFHVWVGVMGLFVLYGAAFLGATWQSRVDKADFVRVRDELYECQDELSICDHCCLDELHGRKP